MPAIPFSLPNNYQALTGASFGATDLVDALKRGFEAGNKPSKLSQDLLAATLANKINAVKAQYAPQMQEADLAHLGAQTDLAKANLGLTPYRQKLLEAQAERATQLANQPFQGLLTGAPREAYALDLLKTQMGEDSESYKNAKKAFELSLASKQELNDYRHNLMGTANKRAATQLGKLSQEEQEVVNGTLPGSGGTISLTPEQQQELLGKYQLQKQKITTDTQTRNRSLLATNVDKTIESIDPKSLTQYAGLAGAINKKIEEGKAPLGKESANYRKYSENLSKVKLLAHQVRQFYGDSIQPAMTQAIELMVNPGTWKNNPELALQSYNAVVNVLKKETQTYKKSLKGISEYEPDSNVKAVKAGPSNASNTAPINSVGLYRNGKLYYIPSDKVDAALAKGFTYE